MVDPIPVPVRRRTHSRDSRARWRQCRFVSYPRAGAILVCCLAAVLGGLAATVERAQARPPNVLIILADDQGWGDLSLHGNTNLATPAIDSLARDGARLEHFFACPVCSPTRAEFLTGRYHPRGGVWSTSTGGERLDLDETTIADVFRAAGYTTAAFGKWHNGSQYPYHPLGRGFDEFYGFCSGHWGQYFDPLLEHNGRPVRGQGYITDDLTSRAIDFLTAHRADPLFCYVAYNTPHSPMQVPERFWQKFAAAPLPLRASQPDDEDVPHTRAALAMCENIDWNVGRLLAHLEELDLARDTVVVYFSDNGPNGWRYNGGLRGRKGSTDEGGVRVPLLVRWPEKIPEGTRVAPIAAAIDLLPTLAELAGVTLPTDGPPLDGVSLAPLLSGSQAAWPDRMIFSHWAGRVSVRTQQYRLDHEGRLYDMLADPGQADDLARIRPQVAARLSAAVDAWRREMLPGLTDDKRAFPVGYHQMPTTYLPARDGVPHGRVQRSARAPNCSFFTGWQSTDDRMTWSIDVHTAGRYEAVLYYTCAADDVGARIELRVGEAAVTAEVAPAHDPPLVGAADDRVERVGESYVKEFRPLALGEFDLEPGTSTLVLRALEVPGDRVADVRAVALRLVE